MASKCYLLERVTKDPLLVKLRDWTPATTPHLDEHLSDEEWGRFIELLDAGAVSVYPDIWNIQVVTIHGVVDVVEGDLNA